MCRTQTPDSPARPESSAGPCAERRSIRWGRACRVARRELPSELLRRRVAAPWVARAAGRVAIRNVGWERRAVTWIARRRCLVVGFFQCDGALCCVPLRLDLAAARVHANDVDNLEVVAVEHGWL